MSLEQETLIKLVELQDKIKESQHEYDTIVSSIGWDIKICSRCKGTKLKSVYKGSACGEDYYDSQNCNCYCGYELYKLT